MAPRVAVIDDNPTMREELAYQIRQQGFEPITVDAIGSNRGALISYVQAKASYAICDLRLEAFTADLGAEIVADLTTASIPAVLFSTSTDDDLPEFRHLLDKIPRFMTRDELNNVNLRTVFDEVTEELTHDVKERRAYKTLVRVEDVLEDRRLDVVIPGWNAAESVEMSMNGFPEDVRPTIKAGTRIFADVNLHATKQSDLFIKFLYVAEEADPGDGLG